MWIIKRGLGRVYKAAYSIHQQEQVYTIFIIKQLADIKKVIGVNILSTYLYFFSLANALPKGVVT